MSFGLGDECLQVGVEKCNEILIKIFSEKMCYGPLETVATSMKV